MASDLCRLSLVYPQESDSALVELLETVEPPLPGFTTWSANGHGQGFDGASHAERVSGRVSRRVATMVLPRSQADALLEHIGEQTPIRHLMFWIEPVLSAGRMA